MVYSRIFRVKIYAVRRDAAENSDKSQGDAWLNNKDLMMKNIWQLNLLVTKRNYNSGNSPIIIR